MPCEPCEPYDPAGTVGPSSTGREDAKSLSTGSGGACRVGARLPNVEVMTAVLAQTSTTGTTPVAEGVARVHRVLDEVDAAAVGRVSGHDVAEVERAISRLAALKLALVSAADRQGAAERAGMTNTGTWLAAHTRAWGAKAAADVALATTLESSLPVTRQALADGLLSTEHAAVIAGTTSRLPDYLSEAERVAIETALVAKARHLDPARLRRSARRALEAAERSAEEVLEHEDAELRGEESRAARRVRLSLHDNLDGTVTGHFTVPTLAGAILRKTIQQMVSPRRRSPAGDAEADAAEDAKTRDWPHEYGNAFVELLEHLPTDRLSGKVAATVVVTIDHDRLREGLGAAHLDTGHDLSASEARRLACSAGVLPAILDGASQPLDLGRTKRFFTEAQRVALATTYDRCAAEGCDRPYAWVDLHHEDPWAEGGATNLDLAVPLCGKDHRRAHDRRFETVVRTAASGCKSVTFHRRP